MGIKLLLIFVGNASGLTFLTSLGLLKDWDPPHIWRISAEKEFYLTTCRQRRESDDYGAKKRWIYSDLQVYLKFKDGKPELIDNTQLQLIGRGYYKKLVGTRIDGQETYMDSEDLHQTTDDLGIGKGRFSLTAGATTGINWLGEGGGGVDSSSWGDKILCDESKKLFTFEGFPTSSSTGLSPFAYLSQIIFVLDKCDSIKTNCSIKIVDNDFAEKNSGHIKGLKWANEFNPIVIK